MTEPNRTLAPYDHRVEDEEIGAFVTAVRDEVVTEAEAAIRRTHLPHYKADARVRARLEALFDLLSYCVRERDLRPIVQYSGAVGGERFAAGYDLSEVQIAFNVLEEAAWRRALADLPAARAARAIGLISTVLGAGKDALARAYVSSATQAHVPSLDMTRLFAGTDGL